MPNDKETNDDFDKRNGVTYTGAKPAEAAAPAPKPSLLRRVILKSTGVDSINDALRGGKAQEQKPKKK